MMKKIGKKKITILALDGTVASTVIGPMDIFSLAGVLWNQVRGQNTTPYFDVKIASDDGHRIQCHNGLSLQPHVSIHAAEGSDLILIPAVNVDNLKADSKKLRSWLIRQFNEGVKIASICTGAFLLAETGLLDGKSATTHWGYIEVFRERYPQVLLKPERLVTDEGQLFCAGGLHSYYDLSLYLIEKYCGFEIAAQCSKAFLLDLNRTSQNTYALFDFQKKHGDDEVLKAQRWMEANFARKISLKEVAASVHMSLRNFKRRFKQATGDAPMLYLQRLRVEKAKRALEDPRHRIEAMSGGLGYEDSASFRQVFKRHVGLTPSDYRRRFLGRQMEKNIKTVILKSDSKFGIQTSLED